MDISTVCDPLPAYPGFALHFSGFGSLPPVGRKNSSYTCSRDCRAGSHCTVEGIPETPVITRSVADGCRSGLHFRRRLVGRSPAVTHGRGSRHSHWQRFDDLRSQNESHILSRLQLQPFRLDICQIVNLVALRVSQAICHRSEMSNHNASWAEDFVELASALDYQAGSLRLVRLMG